MSDETFADKFKKIPFKHMFFLTLFVALLMSESFNQFIAEKYNVIFKLLLFAFAYMFIYMVAELKII